MAMAELLRSWGVEPAAMIGHSAGEYAAAALAGVFSRDDGLALVALRGQLFERLPAGGMLSVAASADDLADLLAGGLDIAALNTPGQCVLSGPIERIAAAEARAGDPTRSMPPGCTSTSPRTPRCSIRSSPSSASSAGRSGSNHRSARTCRT